jgi:hypothetical protein
MKPDPTKNSPFPGMKFAGPLVDLESLALEITLNEEWLGYMNDRVLKRINDLHGGRLAYLQFLPDEATGDVIMVPGASEKDYGAMEVKYSPTENGAFVNLRLAVKPLKIKKLRGRVRVFPLVERLAPNGKIYLACVTKDAETRPTQKRGAGEAAAGAQPEEKGKQA